MKTWTKILDLGVIVLLLFGCLLPMPYWYYQLIRVVCCIGFWWLYSFSKDEKRVYLMASCIICIILFNPIIPIRFERNVWQIIDVSVAGLLLIWLTVVIRDLIKHGAEDY